MSNKKLEVREIPEEEFKKPNIVFDLENCKDHNPKRENIFKFIISTLILIIIFTTIIKTDAKDIPKVLQIATKNQHTKKTPIIAYGGTHISAYNKAVFIIVLNRGSVTFSLNIKWSRRYCIE